MLLLGLDIGTSSVKATIVDGATQKIVASASYPDTEAEIISVKPGWAEQEPQSWWNFATAAILKCHDNSVYDPADISAIGIAYQMHGLVVLDKNGKVLRPSIIWCDSRAVELGNQAFEKIGEDKCLSHLLNSPGNFTASKLAWVKENEPEIFKQIDKIMLPGDYIAYKLTKTITTSASALSEGIFWDFKNGAVSDDVLGYYGFDEQLLPEIQPVFSDHGYLTAEAATALKLSPGIPVTYKAGDQPNNALSLNVLQPGEVATTAGTSGVIYGVTDQLEYDTQSRINSFAHVNYSVTDPKIGILLCLNGTGIFYRWLKELLGNQYSYQQMNTAAASVSIGSEGLFAVPYGNGAERILCNQFPGASFLHLNFNLHKMPHMVRSVTEGIAFSFRYGLDIMRANGLNPTVVRAGKANLFLSDVFTQIFADVTNTQVEFFEGDGSYGAAIGAGIGAGFFTTENAFSNRLSIGEVHPKNQDAYEPVYQAWKKLSS